MVVVKGVVRWVRIWRRRRRGVVVLRRAVRMASVRMKSERRVVLVVLVVFVALVVLVVFLRRGSRRDWDRDGGWDSATGI